MKRSSALAVLDFDDIPAGIFAVDSILKKAPIAFVRAGTVTRGRYLVLFGGSTAATAESLAEARTTSGSGIIDFAFLPDIHPALFDSVFGLKRRVSGALLVIETETASSVIRAVEAAMKGTGVELIEVRISDAGLSGKGVALMAGTLDDVEAAAMLAAEGVGVDSPPPLGFSYRIIPAPHEVVERDIAIATRFDVAPLLDLDGEIG